MTPSRLVQSGIDYVHPRLGLFPNKVNCQELKKVASLAFCNGKAANKYDLTKALFICFIKISFYFCVSVKKKQNKLWRCCRRICSASSPFSSSHHGPALLGLFYFFTRISEVAMLMMTDRCGHPVAFTTPALTKSTSRMNSLLTAIPTGFRHIFVEAHDPGVSFVDATVLPPQPVLPSQPQRFRWHQDW